MDAKKSKKWIWITLVIVVVLVAAALLLWHFLGNSSEDLAAEAAASVQDVTTYCNKELKPEDFLVSPDTAYTVSFQEQPSTAAEGTQTVTLVFANEHGKEAAVTAELTVVNDVTAPKIEAAEVIELKTGAAFDPMEGVTVTDDLDSDPQISSTTNVDTSKPGEYSVRYKAVDASGNKSFEVIKVLVSE